jgi:hypothetical protein
MQYHFTPNRNFEDFASGRVFYTQPGQPAFPVRLASEVFQRCLVQWKHRGGTGLCTIYDPTCGGAYWLVVLAYLHWNHIGRIFASDMDAVTIDLARRNLSLLTTHGLGHRISEIETMLSAYNKESHAGALESAKRFRRQLNINLKKHAIQTQVFQADSTESQAIHQGTGDAEIDILLADVPYGWHSTWQKDTDDRFPNPIWKMLDAIRIVLSYQSVIAIAADKRPKVWREGYQRLDKFKVGKRQIVILGLENTCG